jgi:hypothetical protein
MECIMSRSWKKCILEAEWYASCCLWKNLKLIDFKLYVIPACCFWKKLRLKALLWDVSCCFWKNLDLKFNGMPPVSDTTWTWNFMECLLLFRKNFDAFHSGTSLSFSEAAASRTRWMHVVLDVLYSRIVCGLE